MNQIKLKFNSIALTILLIAFVFEATTVAQTRFPFGKSSRQKAKLNLTEHAGPWLVMCAAFDGEDGRQQAINLADDLRKNHRLTAYVYRQHFDFAKEVENRGMGFQKLPLLGDRMFANVKCEWPINLKKQSTLYWLETINRSSPIGLKKTLSPSKNFNQNH